MYHVEVLRAHLPCCCVPPDESGIRYTKLLTAFAFGDPKYLLSSKQSDSFLLSYSALENVKTA